MASVERPARKPARAPLGPIVLAAVMTGASIDAVATSNQLSRKQAERALRTELRKRWIAPAQEYARLQIARLEAIAITLKKDAARGDLPTIDRLLRVLDRLDRYHGFSRLVALSTSPREDVREKLAKISVSLRGSEACE